MKLLLAALFALCAFAAGAQGIQQGATLLGTNAGAGYVGPGNVVTGWAAWWGLRGYNAAFTGAAIRVRRASDSAESDINILYGGALDTNTLTNFCSGTSCFLAKFYDQTGNGRDCVQATAGNQMPINMSNAGIGFRPSVNSASAKSCTTSVTWTQVVPISSFMVVSPNVTANRTLSSASGAGGPNFQATTSTTFNALRLVGNALSFISTDTFAKGAWITAGAVANGASSALFTNASKVTGTVGSIGAVASTLSVGQINTGNVAEGGWYPGTIADADFTALNANAHIYWGF